MADRTPRGALASLYDMSFRAFITPKIIGGVYAVALILIGIWSLLFLASGFTPNYGFTGYSSAGTATIAWHVIATPIVFLLGSIVARICLEFVLAVFRIAEHTESPRARPPSNP